jgi:hypothetical protein
MSEGWKEPLKADPTEWLLEPDPDNPGVRYFALTDLLECTQDDPRVVAAKRAIMEAGPVPAILAQQHDDGYWVKPGPGYNPKYRSSVWSLILLAQLGADGDDPRVRAGCDYLLDNSPAKNGAFSMQGTPSSAILCLGGNLGAALLALGWLGDERLEEGLDWLARAITGDGFGPKGGEERFHYLKSGTSGPGFLCSGNNRMPCAWGAVKAMLAFGKLPPDARTPAIRAAVENGIGFLLSRDPAAADYPAGWSDKPSRSWFKFGFPVFYVTDVLQNLEALTALGVGPDPRLDAAVELVLSKQDAQGRWKMEYTYKGKTFADIEEKGQPSKWVTLRALRVLKALRGP